MKPNLDLPSHFLKYATVVLWASLVWPVLGAQVLVPAGSVWKYLDNGTDQGTAWYDPSFNDGAWPSGPAQLGYGDGDEATVVSSGPNPTTKNITTYFRHSFEFANASGFSNLTARLLEDDGAVVYVNGVEVFRSNLPSGPIAFNTLATVAAENQRVEFLIPPIVLVNARNVIAVEMHQNNAASSDLSFDLELSILDNEPPANSPPTVQLVSPVTGAVFVGPTNILLLAHANDPDGFLTIQTVEFFEGGNSLGLKTNLPVLNPLGPFVLTWPSVPPGQYALTAVATDDHGARGTSAPVNIIVRTNTPPDPGGRELHAISVYSGAFNGGASPNHQQGQASVVVNRPGQRVSLFLTSYEPVLWHVTSGNATVIEKVILGGYYRQEIDGLGAEVPVIRRYYDEGQGTSEYLYPGTTLESGRFFRILQKLCDLMGMDLASFQGTSLAPYPTPFVIDQVQNDVRLRCDYPQPVDTAQVPNLSFRFAFHDGGTGGGITFQDYTLQGGNASRLLPTWRVVTDADGRYYYGADFHRSWKVDTQTGTVEELHFPTNLPEFSWPVGITFDAPRNRILVATLVGEGYLYAYSPASSQWSLVSSLHNEDLDCLVYHPANDSLYGVKAAYYDGGAPALLRFDTNGALTGQIPLPVQPYGVGFGGFRSELASVGEYLVLVLETDTYVVDNGRPEARIYLIDPRTGEVQLTYRRVGISENRAPTVSLTSPASGDTFPAGSSISLEATAADSDGTVQFVEFLANGQSLGFGTTIPGTTLFRRTWSNAPPGQYTLTAKARDNEGAVSSSAPVQIIVGPPPTNHPPEVRLAMPTNGATFMAPARIGLFAVANDPDGYPTLRYVQFFANDTSLGIRTNFPVLADSIGPFFLLWTNVPAGQYTLTAKAVDDHGAMATSAPVHITVRDSSPMDTDGDGVPDDHDDCTNTPAGALVNSHGCSLDQLCPCPGPEGGHGDYVQCVIDYAWQFFREGLLTEDQRREIIRVAAQSDCGQPNGVRLHQQPQTPPEIQRDGREFIISGIHGGCVLECSTDLQTWIPTVSNPSADTDCRIVDLESDPMPARFYRVRLMP